MEDAKLSRKLNGFHRHFKGRFLLLSNGVLTQNEYILWDLGFSVLAGWDKKNHPENYGVIRLTQQEIGLYLNWDKSVVCKTIKSLVNKGFWQIIGRSEYIITGYNISEFFVGITSSKKLIDLQQFIASGQHKVSPRKQLVSTQKSNPAKEEALLQAQNVSHGQHSNSHTLISSKDNLVSFLRSDEEYEQLSKELNIPVQDLRDMDESISESTPVSPEDEIPELDF